VACGDPISPIQHKKRIFSKSRGMKRSIKPDLRKVLMANQVASGKKLSKAYRQAV